MQNIIHNQQLILLNPLNEKRAKFKQKGKLSNDWLLLKEAISLRQEVAISNHEQFLATFDHNESLQNVNLSLLKNIYERNPFEHCLEKLSFSLLIAEKAVKKVLASNYSTLEKIGIIGYIMELSAQQFIDPFNVKALDKNLAASKQLGYFFTPTSLTIEMASLISHSEKPVKKLFDPGCGSGTLLAITLLFNPKIKEIVGVEIDPFTAKIARLLLSQVAMEVKASPQITILNVDYLDFTSAEEIKEKFTKYFDAVIMNPPYGRIRFISTNLTNFQTRIGLDGLNSKKLQDKLREQHISTAEEYRNKFKDIGLNKGTPEYSTLFLASTVGLVKKGGVLIAITPTSWLADQNGRGLRKYILDKHTVKEIWYFNETAKLFPGVNQPTAVILIKSGNYAEGIKIKSNITSLEDLHKDVHALDEDKLRQFSPEWFRFPRYGNSRTDILLKLHKHKELSKHPDISNLRGEFDLTLNKELISNNIDLPRLIRGDHIELFHLRGTQESVKDGHVKLEPFMDKLGNSIKRKHIEQWRIAIPQCTYLQKKKRIEACLVPPGSIISNSCNYIAIDNNKDSLLLYCAYLNSLVIEWRFRLFNSNNHIANYEIDELPVVEKQLAKGSLHEMIIDAVKHYVKGGNEEELLNIDALIAKSYELSVDEFQLLLDDVQYSEKDKLINKFKSL